MPNQKCLLIPPRHSSCCQASSSSQQWVVIQSFVRANLPTCLCAKLGQTFTCMYISLRWPPCDDVMCGDRSWDSLFWLLLFHIFGHKTFAGRSPYHFVWKTLHVAVKLLVWDQVSTCWTVGREGLNIWQHFFINIKVMLGNGQVWEPLTVSILVTMC